MSERIAVAKIEGAFGVRGALKVCPFAGRGSVLPQQTFCWLGFGNVSTHECFQIKEKKWHRSSLLLFLEPNIARGPAHKWLGAHVLLEREQFPETRSGEYYQSDLLGFKVVNQAGLHLGDVNGFLDAPVHAIMLVKNTTLGNKEHLLPFVEAVIKEVSLANAKITVDWLP